MTINLYERRPIPGFPGYFAANDGQIWSCRTGTVPRFLKGWVDRDGYIVHHLMNDAGVRKTVFAHSMILLTFMGPRPVDKQCRHLNGKPNDNRTINLKYGTGKENAQDRILHGNYTILRGEAHPSSILCQEQVDYIRTEIVCNKTMLELSRELGVSMGCISSIIYNLNWFDPNYTPPIASNVGESHSRSLLTTNDVIQIKQRLRDGEMSSVIARDFPVGKSAISAIKTGYRWSHVQI